MKRAVWIGSILLLCVSCVSSKEFYDWKGYNDAVYKYVKAPTEQNRQKLIGIYREIIENPYSIREVPPPGMYADYGFLLLETGETERALELLKKETEIYPESTPFIERIVKRLEP